MTEREPKVTFCRNGDVKVKEHGKPSRIVGRWKRIPCGQKYMPNFRFNADDGHPSQTYSLQSYLRREAIAAYRRKIEK